MRLLILFSLLAVSVLADQDDETYTTDQNKEIDQILNGVTGTIADVAVHASDVSFYVYTKNDREGKQVLHDQAAQLEALSGFDKNLDTIFVIHGWVNKYTGKMSTTVVNSLLDRSTDANVIAVDWDKLANALYTAAYSAVPKVGVFVGDFILSASSAYNYSLDRVSLVGHSLGAHISGYAGQKTGGQLHTIVGLDPAGPLYLKNSKDHRLSEDDAKYVLGIHTNAKRLGVNYRIGAADFWPNGGYVQNGCGVDITGSCSHYRSYKYYAESISDNNFIGTECSNYDDYEAGDCAGKAKAAMGGPVINNS